MNDVLTYNYISERLGDWECYLESLKMMLPYLAATGHRPYAKCMYWFIQEMETLDDITLQSFREDSGFVVGRTDNPFSRTSYDLVIEQTMMASIKGNMGITRGRGFTLLNRLIGMLSRPVVCKLDEVMRKLAGVEIKEGQSGVKVNRKTRIECDNKDLHILKIFFSERFVFDSFFVNTLLRTLLQAQCHQVM